MAREQSWQTRTFARTTLALYATSSPPSDVARVGDRLRVIKGALLGAMDRKKT